MYLNVFKSYQNYMYCMLYIEKFYQQRYIEKKKIFKRAHRYMDLYIYRSIDL